VNQEISGAMNLSLKSFVGRNCTPDRLPESGCATGGLDAPPGQAELATIADHNDARQGRSNSVMAGRDCPACGPVPTLGTCLTNEGSYLITVKGRASGAPQRDVLRAPLTPIFPGSISAYGEDGLKLADRLSILLIHDAR